MASTNGRVVRFGIFDLGVARDSFGPSSGPKLVENVIDVALDRASGDKKAGRNLRVRSSLTHVIHDFALSSREPAAGSGSTADEATRPSKANLVCTHCGLSQFRPVMGHVT